MTSTRKTKVTARQEIRRVADACGWNLSFTDPALDTFSSTSGRVIDVFYSIDNGVRMAGVREKGIHRELIATKDRRKRVVTILRSEGNSLGGWTP